MRTTIAVVLGAISLTSAFVFADKPDVAKSANDEVSTLFFGHDDRVPVNDTTQSPWDAVGQLETASGNLCTATLIAPNLALTAGHCLLTPPKGKADKAVALRFVSNKGLWRYEIHDIEGRVDPTLGKRLKADGDGWIVPPAAAPWDFGLIVLQNYSQLPESMQEQAESLEQLRLMSAGINIRTFEVAATGPGVDTPACLEKVRALMAQELAENA